MDCSDRPCWAVSIWASFPSDWTAAPDQVGGGRGFRGAIIQYGQGILGQRSQRFGVGQAVALLFNSVSLSMLQPGRFDLIGLKGQHFGAPLGILLGGAQVVQFTAQPEQTAGKIYGKPQGWIRSRRNGQAGPGGAAHV